MAPLPELIVPQPPAALALVVGEEEEGDGAQRLVEEHHFPWAVIGEPTGLQPVYRHKGILMEAIRLTGQSGHSSNPALGRNALEGMLVIADALKREDERAALAVLSDDAASANVDFIAPFLSSRSLDRHRPPRYRQCNT